MEQVELKKQERNNTMDALFRATSQTGFMIFEISKRIKRISDIHAQIEYKTRWIEITRKLCHQTQIDIFIRTKELEDKYTLLSIYHKSRFFNHWKQQYKWKKLIFKAKIKFYELYYYQFQPFIKKAQRKALLNKWYMFAYTAIRKKQTQDLIRYKNENSDRETIKKFFMYWIEGTKQSKDDLVYYHNLWIKFTDHVSYLDHLRKVKDAAYAIKIRRQWMQFKHLLFMIHIEECHLNIDYNNIWIWMVEEFQKQETHRNLIKEANKLSASRLWTYFTDFLISQNDKQNLSKAKRRVDKLHSFQRLAHGVMHKKSHEKIVLAKKKMDLHHRVVEELTLKQKAIERWRENAKLFKFVRGQISAMSKKSLNIYMSEVARTAAITIQRTFRSFNDRRHQKLEIYSKAIRKWQSKMIIRRITKFPQMKLQMSSLNIQTLDGLVDVNVKALRSISPISERIIRSREKCIDDASMRASIDIGLSIPLELSNPQTKSLEYISQTKYSAEEFDEELSKYIDQISSLISVPAGYSLPFVISKAIKKVEIDPPGKPKEHSNVINEISDILLGESYSKLNTDFISIEIPPIFESNLDHKEPIFENTFDCNYIVQSLLKSLEMKLSLRGLESKQINALKNIRKIADIFNVDFVTEIVQNLDLKFEKLSVNCNLLFDLSPSPEIPFSFDDDFLMNSVSSIKLIDSVFENLNIDSMNIFERLEIDIVDDETPQIVSQSMIPSKLFECTQLINIEPLKQITKIPQEPIPIFKIEEVLKNFDSIIETEAKINNIFPLSIVTKIEERKQLIPEDFFVDIPLSIPCLGPKEVNISSFENVPIKGSDPRVFADEYSKELTFNNSLLVQNIRFTSNNKDVFDRILEKESSIIAQKIEIDFGKIIPFYNENKSLSNIAKYEKPSLPTLPIFSNIYQLDLSDLQINIPSIFICSREKLHQHPNKEEENNLYDLDFGFGKDFNVNINSLNFVSDRVSYLSLLDQSVSYDVDMRFEDLSINRYHYHFKPKDLPSIDIDVHYISSSYSVDLPMIEPKFEEIRFTKYERPHPVPEKNVIDFVSNKFTEIDFDYETKGIKAIQSLQHKELPSHNKWIEQTEYKINFDFFDIMTIRNNITSVVFPIDPLDVIIPFEAIARSISSIKVEPNQEQNALLHLNRREAVFPDLSDVYDMKLEQLSISFNQIQGKIPTPNNDSFDSSLVTYDIKLDLDSLVQTINIFTGFQPTPKPTLPRRTRFYKPSLKLRDLFKDLETDSLSILMGPQRPNYYIQNDIYIPQIDLFDIKPNYITPFRNYSRPKVKEYQTNYDIDFDLDIFRPKNILKNFQKYPKIPDSFIRKAAKDFSRCLDLDLELNLDFRSLNSLGSKKRPAPIISEEIPLDINLHFEFLAKSLSSKTLSFSELIETPKQSLPNILLYKPKLDLVFILKENSLLLFTKEEIPIEEIDLSELLNNLDLVKADLKPLKYYRPSLLEQMLNARYAIEELYDDLYLSIVGFFDDHVEEAVGNEIRNYVLGTQCIDLLNPIQDSLHNSIIDVINESEKKLLQDTILASQIVGPLYSDFSLLLEPTLDDKIEATIENAFEQSLNIQLMQYPFGFIDKSIDINLNPFMQIRFEDAIKRITAVSISSHLSMNFTITEGGNDEEEIEGKEVASNDDIFDVKEKYINQLNNNKSINSCSVALEEVGEGVAETAEFINKEVLDSALDLVEDVLIERDMSLIKSFINRSLGETVNRITSVPIFEALARIRFQFPEEKRVVFDLKNT